MSLPPLPLWLVNAFTTDTPHSGNQAGVVLFPKDDPRAADDAYKQTIAKDIDYSETSFLTPIDKDTWGLRWWTPTQEVTLCGHATLAAAAVLFSEHPELSSVQLETRWSGQLRATREEAEGNTLKMKIFLPTLPKIQLDQLVHDGEVADQVSAVLGISRSQCLQASCFSYGGTKSSIVQIDPSLDLKTLKVDTKGYLPELAGMNIVTQTQPDACSRGTLSIQSRVFCSGLGIDEDPVTGSAHAYLTGYYLLASGQQFIPQGVVEDGKADGISIDAKQVSDRGGRLLCRLEEDGSVGIVGSACLMAKGSLSVW